MIPLEHREKIMRAFAGETFEGVEAEYVGDATLDVAGATFRLTRYGSLTCDDGSVSCYGLYPDPRDMDGARRGFRVAVARKLGIDYRSR